ncbi:hypothetical protein R75465_07750 [Paraburkholderia aspalathi]|uniref:hypothetical protein n=1 Tax=Paraburkholderia aspalathi TaxID=1324617 RepID=UPI001B270F74|nr:hypothetical protein [Paraburkholderia aspalathi]CAE6862670.1 hypothetical protein R75465_07750 [Paraburkholderia aspalathi]
MDFHVVTNGTDESQPLLYQWEIQDVQTGEVLGRYVGKARAGSRRPRCHYARNVRRLLAGLPYRKNKPEAFRVVHHALADAVRRGDRITLTLLRNISPGEDINEAERVTISALNCTLNGQEKDIYMGWFWKSKKTEPNQATASDAAEKDLVLAEKALARFYLAKSPHPIQLRQAEQRYFAAVAKHFPKADANHLLTCLYTDYDGYHQGGHTKDWGDGTATLFINEQDAETWAKDEPEYREQLYKQYPWIFNKQEPSAS